MEQSIVKQVLAKLNPYIQRYCENKYAPQIKQLLFIILSDIPDDINISEETLINTPHELAYDYKPLVVSSMDRVLKGKSDLYVEGFFESILKLMRGGYIDKIQNGNLERDEKIAYGKFFITLIENISLIEAVNIDEYIKFKDHVTKETVKLETAIPQIIEIEYYYWKYPHSYLKCFEELLLKYDFIEKHPNFDGLFKHHAIASQEEKLIKFKGTRPELWYILFRIYKNKLNFMGIPLHKIASDLFVFAGKKNTLSVTNSNWIKFKEHIDEDSHDEQYIDKKLKKAYRLLEELKLPL